MLGMRGPRRSSSDLRVACSTPPAPQGGRPVEIRRLTGQVLLVVRGSTAVDDDSDIVGAPHSSRSASPRIRTPGSTSSSSVTTPIRRPRAQSSPWPCSEAMCCRVSRVDDRLGVRSYRPWSASRREPPRSAGAPFLSGRFIARWFPCAPSMPPDRGLVIDLKPAWVGGHEGVLEGLRHRLAGTSPGPPSHAKSRRSDCPRDDPVRRSRARPPGWSHHVRGPARVAPRRAILGNVVDCDGHETSTAVPNEMSNARKAAWSATPPYSTVPFCCSDSAMSPKRVEITCINAWGRRPLTSSSKGDVMRKPSHGTGAAEPPAVETTRGERRPRARMGRPSQQGACPRRWT